MADFVPLTPEILVPRLGAVLVDNGLISSQNLQATLDRQAELRERGVHLEMAVRSNVQTGAVPDLESHPLKLYFDLGLRVTVNTDNRLITGTTVSRELWLVHTRMRLAAPFTMARTCCRLTFQRRLVTL